MEVDADRNKNQGDGDGSVSSLRLKTAKLERKLLEEKDRYDLLQSESTLAKLVSSQEADRYRRECSSLRETVLRLKEDCNTLREREARDQQAIKGLLEAIEKKEREYFELKMENADLERAKRRLQDEVFLWKEKYGEVEARALRLFGELKEKENAAAEKAKGKEHEELESVILKAIEKKFHLKNEKGRHESEIDEELPSQEPRRKRKFVAVGGDGIPLSKKSHVQASEGNEKDSGSLREVGGTGAEEETSDEVTDARIRSVPVYKTQKVAEKGLRANHKRNFKNQISQRTYIGRVPSSEQILSAKKRAETLQSNLRSSNPSFIKLMVQSNVSGGFWLGIPSKFCKDNLPAHELKMILEDERCLEYIVNCIGHRTGLSGGWRAFSLAHNLETGDALIFELRKPARFKVYIVKAIPEELREGFDGRIVGEHTDGTNKWANTNITDNQDVDLSDFRKNPLKSGHAMQTGR